MRSPTLVRITEIVKQFLENEGILVFGPKTIFWKRYVSKAFLIAQQGDFGKS